MSFRTRLITVGRPLVFRLIMLVVLLVSPILFPALLLVLRVLDGEWARGGLAALYCWAWQRLLRGYP